MPKPLDPTPILRSPTLSVIAEVKRSSPSRGLIRAIDDPVQLAKTYEAGGAAVVSVLTEQRAFAGSLKDLEAVSRSITVPTLRKDFIVSEYQVWEARAAGASLILLIVAALDDQTLTMLFRLAERMGMKVLVEVHSADEAKRAVQCGAEIVGVNARNLRTLAVDPNRFEEIARHLPASTTLVAESGVRDAAQAHRYADLGAHAVLVGEALVLADDPRQIIAAMSQRLTKPHGGRASGRTTPRADSCAVEPGLGPTT